MSDKIKPLKSVKNKNKKSKIQVFTKKKKNLSETEDIEKLRNLYNSIDKDKIKTFDDVPLSKKTLQGLKASGYTIPTEIQLQTIDLSLQGKDILGAAQTGSGKTLAFLIPILELLYCKQWTRLDGIGALVITPTRELAYQIFETLRKVGEYHDFSAGLIIGGKDLKFERKRLDQCNIIICTPGRLLQHMDENPLFDCVNLQILVLDEADRCLDLGFEKTMNAIIENLPPLRQTLLFSATQTKSVKDLARLSLKDPCYITSYKNSEFSTPEGLEQSYVVCELGDKISILWSFIKNHLKQKCIIFFASCKEVKYVYEMFCHLRPGVSLMALYGTLHQLRRMEIYETFCKKTSAVLFATDIAARGLDFPKVNWVVQVDCPEDAATYVHRVGRTARYYKGGNSLLMLLPTETALIEHLENHKIPINKIDINAQKLQNPIRKMEAQLAKMPALKDTAKRAFVSYIKSIFLMRNKEIFKVQALQDYLDSYAKSLGLAITPRVRFLQRFNNTANKKTYFKDDEQNEGNATDDDEVVSTNNNRAEVAPKPFSVPDDSDSDDGILKIKRQNHDIDLPSKEELEEMDQIMNTKKKKKALSKVAMAKKVLKKQIVANKKVIFNDEGEAIQTVNREKQSELAKEYEEENAGGIDVEKAKLVLREEDKFDKQLFKEKVKAKHKEEKRKRKEKTKKEESDKDDFGSGSDEEPDLSWLPDPDKIYGEKSPVEQHSGSDSSETEEFKNASITPKKSMKRKHQNEMEKVAKKKSKLTQAASSFSINEAEELALMLLKNK